MKPKIYLLALAAALIAPLAPQAVLADTIDQFTVSGTYYGGSTLSGTITIDTTTGVVQAADLAWSTVVPDLTIFAENTFGPTPPYPAYASIEVSDSVGDFVGLVFPVSSFVDYTGGSLCNGYFDSPPLCPYSPGPWATDAYEGVSPSTTLVSLETGTVVLTSVVSTPEPSGLLLLSTGLLSLVGVIRRKRLA